MFTFKYLILMFSTFSDSKYLNDACLIFFAINEINQDVSFV